MDSYKNFTGHRYWCILSKYRAIFTWWLELKHISMDFKFCLLAPCSDRVTRICPKVIISRLIGDDWGRHDCKWCENAGNSVEPKFLNLNYSENTAYFKTPFWLLVDNNCIYIVPEHQPLAPPRNTQTKVTSFTMSMSTMFVHVQKHGKCSKPAKIALKWPSAPC